MNKRIKSFEGLRALMAFVIFLSHASFFKYTFPSLAFYEKYFDNGGFAVAFFFILSGFVITMGYGEKFAEITPGNYFAFIKKRVIRIYPIYIVTMLWAAIYNVVVEGESIIVTIVKFLVSATMLQTLLPGNGTMLNSAAWFISCIVVLYLITPWLLQAISGIYRKSSFIVCMLDCVVVIVVWDILMATGVVDGILPESVALDFSYAWPVYRLPFYMFGMFLCKFFMAGQARHGQQASATVAEIIAIVILIAGYFLTMGTTDITALLKATPHTYGFFIAILKNVIIFPLIGVALYIFARDKGALSKFFGGKFMSKLGAASLDFFLIHYVIIWKSVSHIMFSFLYVTDLNLWIIFVVDLVMSVLVTMLAQRVRRRFIK